LPARRQNRSSTATRKTYGFDRLELLIDWGWFHFITKPMFYLIRSLHGILGNFGLAILAVTVIVKGLFFPLANRSYASMAAMRRVQPEMKSIQERFKDDRTAQQQAMMELYKKEKINPLSGCWPMLIQIPVFFSLYKVLFVTIEMRHAPFFGWIKDLAAPDPTNIFTLFGLIPWDPTAVPLLGGLLHLGIWPLIMGVTMWVQMRLNPPPPDPTQAMIFNWMPVIFTFMLGSFPAGLVIYWAWNNTAVGGAAVVHHEAPRRRGEPARQHRRQLQAQAQGRRREAGRRQGQLTRIGRALPHRIAAGGHQTSQRGPQEHRGPRVISGCVRSRAHRGHRPQQLADAAPGQWHYSSRRRAIRRSSLSPARSQPNGWMRWAETARFEGKHFISFRLMDRPPAPRRSSTR
jgi:YidC/Oxa1 family membrane protein insertase